jgi:hypothetical protein
MVRFKKKKKTKALSISLIKKKSLGVQFTRSKAPNKSLLKIALPRPTPKDGQLWMTEV